MQTEQTLNRHYAKISYTRQCNTQHRPLCDTKTTIMAALKRKEAPKSHKASGHVKTKKPKIESISEKKSLKKTSKIQSAVESNTAEEIDISESDNFGGFSEDDRTGTSISEEEIEAGNDDTNIANSKHANGVTQAAKPTNASVAANSCTHSSMSRISIP